jgi:hypothetical protein
VTEENTLYPQLAAAWVHGDAARMAKVVARIEELGAKEEGAPGPFHLSLAQAREILAQAKNDAAAFAKLAKEHRHRWIKTQAARTLEDLRLLDAATDQWAIEHNKAAGAVATWEDLRQYLKRGSRLHRTGATVFGDSFGQRFIVDEVPTIPAGTWTMFEGIVDWEFFQPFPIAAN